MACLIVAKRQNRKFSKNMGVLIKHVDQRQLVTFTNLVVIKVMGRSNLDTTGPELGINIFISDDGNFTPY